MISLAPAADTGTCGARCAALAESTRPIPNSTAHNVRFRRMSCGTMIFPLSRHETPAQQRSSCGKMSCRSGSDMNGEEPREKVGMRFQRAQRAVAQLWLAIQQQQQPSHERGSARQTPVRGLITGKIAGRERIGQRARLMKTEAESFAGDGVHAAGSISNEHNLIPVDAIESAS